MARRFRCAGVSIADRGTPVRNFGGLGVVTSQTPPQPAKPRTTTNSPKAPSSSEGKPKS